MRVSVGHSFEKIRYKFFWWIEFLCKLPKFKAKTIFVAHTSFVFQDAFFENKIVNRERFFTGSVANLIHLML